MEVTGIKELRQRLQALAAATNKDSKVDCEIGYTASYAVYVHENLTAMHKPGKRAKFLEEPARTLKSELSLSIFTSLKAGRTLSQSLLVAGLRLLRESQKIVPVDTGNLKSSGFVRLIHD